MKLLFCIHDYLPEHVGGTEIHAHQVAAELVRRGHEVTALFCERDLSANEGDLRRGELDGVQTIEMVHQREYADVRDTWLQPLAGEVFRAALHELAPDRVHFHHLSLWGARCLETAKEAGARPLVTLNDFHLICDEAVLLDREGDPCTRGPRGACTDCLRRHPLRPERWPSLLRNRGVEELFGLAATERLSLHRRCLAAAERAVCPSRFLADLFLDAGLLREEQVEVLKYGYPGPRREPRATDPSESLRVGYIGGVYPAKGVHVLVDALAAVGEARVSLEVWGDLDWFPDYVAGLRDAAAGREVEFRGRYDPTAVDEVLSRFDLLAVPSLWYENMPLTIQEAFRNGVPVVTSDLGGMAEAVEDGVSGRTFPRGDARALGAILAELATDRDELLRLARGRPHVPTLEEVVDRLEAIYGGD